MARALRPAAIDSETGPILDRPDYPPKAVGYAVAVGRRSEYLAFGHPTGNNCTKAEALRRVREVAKTHRPVFHNSAFDVEVLASDGVRVGEHDDTMVMAFLSDPGARSLGLKELAEERLGIPPDEQTVLRDWILAHVPEAKKKPSTWAAHICRAPGPLVGAYARADVTDTLGLLDLYGPDLRRRGMWASYEREMAVLPVKLAMEAGGIRVRQAKLRRDMGPFQQLRDELEARIRRRLRVGRTFNVDSGQQLADALLQRDLLTEVLRTKPTKSHPEGQVRTGRDVLEANCSDKRLVDLLSMHGVLGTYLNTFMRKWLEQAARNDGYVHPSFHTTRSADDWGGHGARTGRLSSSDPNFQNIPNNIAGAVNERVLLMLAKELARLGVEFIGMRDYLSPDEGCVFIRRDYSQQELRILAHFEEGAFLRMYLEDPSMDAHDAVQELVRRDTGVLYDRKYIKNTNFGILYGMGAPRLAQRLGIDVREARALKRAVMRAIPGIDRVIKQLEKAARRGESYRTWGDREYFCEPPAWVDDDEGGKRKRTFEYKMLNYKIQGSAADCTKVGMVQTHDRLTKGRLVLQVHDELLASVPKGHEREQMRIMREAMEDVGFRVPMRTEGEVAAVSWARMRGVDW